MNLHSLLNSLENRNGLPLAIQFNPTPPYPPGLTVDPRMVTLQVNEGEIPTRPLHG